MAAKDEAKMSLASLREKLKILQIQSSNGGINTGRVPDTPSSTSILRDVQLNSTPATAAYSHIPGEKVNVVFLCNNHP